MASWTAEGQATLAEEVVGNAVEGRSPGNDYGLDVAFNLDDPSSTDWYSDRFIDLATYFGYESQTLQLASAPQECSWLAQHPANPGPCIGGRDVYGVPWSILRWLSDQFGPTFPGGEQGLQRALIDNDAVGYANLANVVNVPIDTLLAQWGAMLYTDDRMPGVNPRLSLPSWNLLYIFFFGYGNVALPATTHLLPHEHPYVSFTETFNVRAGSAAYMLLNGTAGGSMAMGIRVRTADGGPLPPNMQIFVVRMD